MDQDALNHQSVKVHFKKEAHSLEVQVARVDEISDNDPATLHFSTSALNEEVTQSSGQPKASNRRRYSEVQSNLKLRFRDHSPIWLF